MASGILTSPMAPKTAASSSLASVSPSVCADKISDDSQSSLDPRSSMPYTFAEMSIGPVTTEVKLIFDDKSSRKEPETLEYWKSRALSAERSKDGFANLLFQKDDQISKLKTKLASYELMEKQFVSTKDLAAATAAVREAAPVVKDIQPQL